MAMSKKTLADLVMLDKYAVEVMGLKNKKENFE